MPTLMTVVVAMTMTRLFINGLLTSSLLINSLPINILLISSLPINSHSVVDSAYYFIH